MASAIWNHSMAASNPLANPTPMSTSSDGNDSGDSQASISANDFLTLLVTEMKNQDPTADTDPNEYIDQLVQVNSLEQLIDMNQNLSTALGITDSSASGDATKAPVAAVSGAHAPAAAAPATSGNLNVPHTSPAAERVAQALSGRK